jgi:YebC/PmpR family DNA-binding regulatory protein
MPKNNIDRAIKKGERNDSDSNYEEIRYEGYGPGGVAIIIEAMTNNKNRTAAEIRSAFNKFGGSLGENGSVSYSFKRFGEISINKKLVEENKIFEFAIDNESKDLEVSEDTYLIYCEQNDLHTFNEKIIKKFGETISSQLVWKSENNIDIQKDSAEKLFKLLNMLEDNEDVQNISSNFEVSEEILATFTQ